MNQLKAAFEKLNISWNEGTEKKLMEYMRGVLAWNDKVNLTAITDEEEFITKHLIDSVLCCGFEEYDLARRIIDVGTGAGFPGIPLSIISPDKEFVLADSLAKRLKIIDELARNIGISNIYTVHGRAEELARDKKYRETFDICVSRAVANMRVLAEYCLPFIAIGGHLLAYKGPEAAAELEQAEKAIKILGGRVKRIEPAGLDGFAHNIVVIEKIKETPAKYPRKAGTPSKEPIS